MSELIVLSTTSWPDAFLVVGSLFATALMLWIFFR